SADALRVELTWQAPTQSGEIGRAVQDIDIPDIGLKARLSLYDVLPAPETGLPRYVQTRLELIAPVRAVCLQSVRVREPLQISPLLCAGFTEDAQVGLNAEFKPAPANP